MTKREAIEQSSIVCRKRRLSIHTERSYCGWVARYFDHLKQTGLVREDAARTFLESLAPKSSASTQSQALNAIIFIYRDVLKEPLGEIGGWAKARRPKKLPTWLSHEEMTSLSRCLHGNYRTMAELCYGSGLRVSELLHLRVKDLDFNAGVVVVRGGKGDKDRSTCLPKTLHIALKAHLATIKRLWQQDQHDKLPPIYLPDGLERKFPNGGHEWPWFWLWPAPGLSIDPRLKIERRHHIHADTFSKVLAASALKAGMSKRVTAHVLRHSFATQMLMNGLDVKRLQTLLGHAHIETTSIYLHCLPNLAGTVKSPLDP